MKIIGKTLKTKNKIQEHGDEWELFDIPPNVISMTPNPSIIFAISSLDGHSRWFNKSEIEEVK